MKLYEDVRNESNYAVDGANHDRISSEPYHNETTEIGIGRTGADMEIPLFSQADPWSDEPLNKENISRASNCNLSKSLLHCSLCEREVSITEN